MIIREHYGIDSDGINIDRVYSDVPGMRISDGEQVREHIFIAEGCSGDFEEVEEADENSIDIDGIVEELQNRW